MPRRPIRLFSLSLFVNVQVNTFKNRKEVILSAQNQREIAWGSLLGDRLPRCRCNIDPGNVAGLVKR
jgi:hypothetical protein